VQVWRGTPAKQPGQSSFSSVRQELSQTPCPDTRGYWGDYDGMAAGPLGTFFRGFSDSAHGTCTQAQFTSSPLGASTSIWGL